MSEETITGVLDVETKLEEAPVPIEDHFKSVSDEQEIPADVVDTIAEPACEDNA